MPLPFSIVIPTYNEAAGIGKLLDALDATFRANALDGEIIVVDDNSPDGTGDDRRAAFGAAARSLPAPQRQARAFERRHRRLEDRAPRVGRARCDGRRLQPRRQRTAEDGRSARNRASMGWPSAAATSPAAASRTGRHAASSPRASRAGWRVRSRASRT